MQQVDIAPKTGKPRGAKTQAIVARHRRVFEEAQKTGGKMTPAIIAAGYSPNTANNPKKITGSLSWKALMEEYLPEDKVALRHQELLDKRERRGIYDLRGKLTGYVDEPETASVSRAVEMAYKLRGAFVPEAPPAGSVATYNLFYLPQVRESVRVFEDALKITIASEMSKKPIEKTPHNHTPPVGTESPTNSPIASDRTPLPEK